jgi:hypothetical protein
MSEILTGVVFRRVFYSVNCLIWQLQCYFAFCALMSIST